MLAVYLNMSLQAVDDVNLQIKTSLVVTFLIFIMIFKLVVDANLYCVCVCVCVCVCMCDSVRVCPVLCYANFYVA